MPERRIEPRPPAAPVPPEDGSATRPPGILVVDDEVHVLAVLAVALRQAGFCVWTAADGTAALETYPQYRGAIDLVLLDVRMPGLDGPQTLAALRRQDPGLRCCFLSGDVSPYTPE